MSGLKFRGKIPVTRRALVQRVQRALRPNVLRNRGGYFFVVNGSQVAGPYPLDALAEKFGCLRAYERLA